MIDPFDVKGSLKELAEREWPNGFNVITVTDWLDDLCAKDLEECTKAPDWLMGRCELLQRNICDKIILEAVQKHCAGTEKSLVCAWLPSTRATPTTVKTTTTRPTTTTTLLTTTAGSATSIIIGCAIGGVALLVFIIVVFFFCRKSSSPDAKDIHGVEANTNGKKMKKKKRGKTTGATTETTGTTDATKSATKKDKKKKKRKNKKKKETRTTGTKTGSTGV